MKILHVFDSLKFLRAIFVAVACMFMLCTAHAATTAIQSVIAYGKTEQNGTPNPTTPVPIMANNGAIKIFVGNKWTNVGMLEGYIIQSAADLIQPNSNYNVSAPILLKAGDYSISYYTPDTGSKPFTIWESNAQGDLVGDGRVFTIARPDVGTNTGTFTIDRDMYVRVSWRKSFTDIVVAPTSAIIYTDGTVETIRDSAGHTAIAQMLLSVGDYKDEQNITTGAITRKVGVKVLDGTENWTYRNTQSGYATFQISNPFSYDLAGTPHIICSHFEDKSPVNGISMVYQMGIGVALFKSSEYPTGRNLYLNIPTSIATDITTFKQYLANQYNAGTPVIVVYPLATETTESVAAQSLTTAPVRQTLGAVMNMPIKTILTDNSEIMSGAEELIKIATTKYNEAEFAPVQTNLETARTTINNLITQMQTNAINVSKLAVEKQTRPNATCPAGKNCLLVMDPTGVENWYVIAGAGDVETAPTTPNYFSFTVEPYTVSYDKYDDNGDYVEHVEDNNHFAFGMTSSGTFTIDWGDGTAPQVVNRPTVTDLYDSASQYSHSYTTGGNKTIKITGRATEYDAGLPVMFFSDYETENESNTFVMAIDGSLGAIFPTLGNGTGQQPIFSSLFNYSKITSIPENLFRGVTGAARGMFYNTFAGTRITSIPAGLFNGVMGAADYMFQNTFAWTQITSIPENLFRGVTGAAEGMFSNTFAGAPITSIPAGLFRGVTGVAEYMFEDTFAYTPITSIPAGLFSGITSATGLMFAGTFSNCLNLTGYIPESTFAGLIQNNSPDASGFMLNIFDRSTGLATTCPQNTTEVSTPYKSKYWSTRNGNAVMCRPN